MSGGSSSGGKKTSTKKDEPAAPTPGPTVPAFMPGMDNMIAQQLQAGGYGNASDLLSYFQQLYSPMTLPGSNVVQGGPAVGSGSGGGSSGNGFDRSKNGWVKENGDTNLYKNGYYFGTVGFKG
jgi:hypothetical protein